MIDAEQINYGKVAPISICIYLQKWNESLDVCFEKENTFLYMEKIPFTKSLFLNHKAINDSKVRWRNKHNKQHKPKIWTTAVKENSKKMKLSDWV